MVNKVSQENKNDTFPREIFKHRIIVNDMVAL